MLQALGPSLNFTVLSLKHHTSPEKVQTQHTDVPSATYLSCTQYIFTVQSLWTLCVCSTLFYNVLVLTPEIEIQPQVSCQTGPARGFWKCKSYLLMSTSSTSVMNINRPKPTAPHLNVTERGFYTHQPGLARAPMWHDWWHNWKGRKKRVRHLSHALILSLWVLFSATTSHICKQRACCVCCTLKRHTEFQLLYCGMNINHLRCSTYQLTLLLKVAFLFPFHAVIMCASHIDVGIFTHTLNIHRKIEKKERNCV